ncbi:hypothetical protein BGZ99_002901 [Dissophora globulifera]|uniref:Uncharacterized protein n=1 Tax=Dissophora globulifera TaxID=979702 RepID=A0A9P6RNQ6_9FUNG|nr:hypothetical protein BGZ99_002901 [Dissophora globulifera]
MSHPDPTPASYSHRVRRPLHFNSSIRATTNGISNDGGARDFGLNATTVHTNTTTKAYTTTNPSANNHQVPMILLDGIKLMDLLGCVSPSNTISVSLLRYLKKKWLELKRGRIASFLSVPIAFVKMVTLNAAVNSYLNELWTVLINNLFVEIKGSAFKMFKKENPIQLSCTGWPTNHQLLFSKFLDIVERIQVSVYTPCGAVTMAIIALLSETTVVWAAIFIHEGCGAAADAVLAGAGIRNSSDWLKHAFITTFNQISPSAYGRNVDFLSYNLVVGGSARLSGRTIGGGGSGGEYVLGGEKRVEDG